MTEQNSPHDVAAERVILGALMLRNDVYELAFPALHAVDFYRPAHQMIAAAILFLGAEGEPHDSDAVAARLQVDDVLNACGGKGYLATLVDAALADPAGLVDRVPGLVQAVASAYLQRLPGRPLSGCLPAALDEMAALSAPGGGLSTGIPTGFEDLDSLLSGLRPGLLHLLFGPPGAGTSTLALDFVRAVTIKHGLAALIFSGQSPRIEVVFRLLAAEARVPLHHLRTGTMGDEDWTRVARRMSEIAEAPMFIEDNPTISLNTLQAKCRQAKNDHDLRLVVIDGVNLYARPTAPETLWAAQTRISADIKRLAGELGVPIVITAPTNRRASGRVDSRPTLDDVASSSAYAADADIVIGLYRPDLDDPKSIRAGEADLIVLKNRYGPSAAVTVAFQRQYSRFVDMAPPATVPNGSAS